jgi:hypothetical protein
MTHTKHNDQAIEAMALDIEHCAYQCVEDEPERAAIMLRDLAAERAEILAERERGVVPNSTLAANLAQALVDPASLDGTGHIRISCSDAYRAAEILREIVPYKDPTGFTAANVLDEAMNWTKRFTGQEMLENYAALLAASPTPPASEVVNADDVAVDRFAVAMKEKLAAARAKGRSGWSEKSDCSQEHLSDLLRAHVGKGDPRDVANFCMFLHQRGESITPPASEVVVNAFIVVDAKGKRFVIYNRELAEAIKNIAIRKGSTLTVTAVCELPDKNWFCTRGEGHEGPCAAWPNSPASEVVE